jgi:ribosomal protein S12 methylthiotransferase accessory factor
MAEGPHPLREGLAPVRHRPRERGWGGGAASALARALGVTRVARLTGLDRTGVEVASAVRPRGHVLQVTNGKGETARDAVAGAVLEAAELAAAERASADAWGSAAELAARHGADAVVPPRALEGSGATGFTQGADSDEVRLAWRAGAEVLSGDLALVPAHAVHVPPPGGPWLGPALVRWTSNGMGASPDPAAALLHALLEVVERDRVARALPDGFTPGAMRSRLLDLRRLARAAPRTAGLVEQIERSGLRVFLLDLTEPAPGRGRGPRPRPGPGLIDLALPTAAALLLDVEGGPVPLAAGYACRLDRDDALRAALLEAAQSRATEIHGAREDVAVSDRHAAEALRALLERTRPARDPRALPAIAVRSAGAGVRVVATRLARAGCRAVAVELDAPAGIAVVKVVAPGLLLSELL